MHISFLLAFILRSCHLCMADIKITAHEVLEDSYIWFYRRFIITNSGSHSVECVNMERTLIILCFHYCPSSLLYSSIVLWNQSIPDLSVRRPAVEKWNVLYSCLMLWWTKRRSEILEYLLEELGADVWIGQVGVGHSRHLHQGGLLYHWAETKLSVTKEQRKNVDFKVTL